MTTSGTRNDNQRQRVAQRVTENDNEWQQMAMNGYFGQFSFFQIREEPHTMVTHQAKLSFYDQFSFQKLVSFSCTAWI